MLCASMIFRFSRITGGKMNIPNGLSQAKKLIGSQTNPIQKFDLVQSARKISSHLRNESPLHDSVWKLSFIHADLSVCHFKNHNFKIKNPIEMKATVAVKGN